MFQNTKNRLLSYQRRATSTVFVGGVGIGGNNPIRAQSMTTSDTKDTASLIKEIEGLVNAGCEIIRVTVPTQADCDNLPNIRAELKKRGLKVPLVADIHFTPSIALKAAEFVEKVRVNPGNFIDKKLFKILEYTDAQYNEELQKLHEKFSPLVLKCKEYGIAMRIGTNHGSLSDRIMNRFGDSAEGMVESALEFARICEDHNYHNIVFSMKASNVQVMTAAYRLLAKRSSELKYNYPFHLGVTEAGAGKEGRIKSAIGIGSLLEDGLGDTVRVSLTEDAIYEVPVVYQLIEKYNSLHANSSLFTLHSSQTYTLTDNRRETASLFIGDLKTGVGEPIRVWSAGSLSNCKNNIQELTLYLNSNDGHDRPIEGFEIVDDLTTIDTQIFSGQKVPLAFKTDRAERAKAVLLSIEKLVVVLDENFNYQKKDWLEVLKEIGSKKIIEFCLSSISFFEESLTLIKECGLTQVLYSIQSDEPVYEYRKLAKLLEEKKMVAHLIHLRVGPFTKRSPLLSSATELGTLLLDGLGDSLQINADLPAQEIAELSYNILQGCRLRVSRTEYISCPSCGRTLFDLQTTTEKIRKKTSHLKGVKIAVMGCIVNGPGEMADADFGYVGTGVKKVSLYVGKDCVERNLPEEQALESLITLIKKHNRWVEPLV